MGLRLKFNLVLLVVFALGLGVTGYISYDLLRKPKDGRLFLIANELPDKLGSRYRFWSWAHLVIFIGAGCAGLIML